MDQTIMRRALACLWVFAAVGCGVEVEMAEPGTVGVGGGSKPAVAPKGGTPHRNLRALPVEHVVTFKKGGVVGNVVWRVGEFIEKDDAAPLDLTEKLTFPQGQPPKEWYGRSYLPCTLKEAMDDVEFESRGARFATEVYIQGEKLPNYLNLNQGLVQDTAFDIEPKDHGNNTMAFDTEKLNQVLATLEPGSYKLVINRYLQIELHVQYVDLKREAWEERKIYLAQGSLAIEVQ